MQKKTSWFLVVSEEPKLSGETPFQTVSSRGRVVEGVMNSSDDTDRRFESCPGQSLFCRLLSTFFNVFGANISHFHEKFEDNSSTLRKKETENWETKMGIPEKSSN